MSESTEPGASRPQKTGPGEKTAPGRRMPRWKKVLLALSVVLMAAGLALQGYAWLARPVEEADRPRAGTKGLLPSGFLADSPPAGQGVPSGQAGETRLDDWYPVMFRLGFSFFVGFCIAYALRTFFKISLVAIGLVLLALVGLQYAGVVSIDWSQMQTHYDAVARWLAEQTATLRQFITGYLPSSATATAGLVAGFRRK